MLAACEVIGSARTQARGTRSSNPVPSSGESRANFIIDDDLKPERGRWTAAIRGTTGSHQTSEAVSPSASKIASEQRLALAALGPAQPHIVPTRSGQPP